MINLVGIAGVVLALVAVFLMVWPKISAARGASKTPTETTIDEAVEYVTEAIHAKRLKWASAYFAKHGKADEAKQCTELAAKVWTCDEQEITNA